MIEIPNALDFKDDEKLFSLKDTFRKYVRYWPWFLGATILFVAIGVTYVRLAPIIYESVARIKILKDANQLNVVSDRISFGEGKLIMENEIATLKSYRLLGDVVKKLNLDVSYARKETFKTVEIWNAPFDITKLYTQDSLKEEKAYTITLQRFGYVIDDEKGNQRKLQFDYQNPAATGLPFQIKLKKNINIQAYIGFTYVVVLRPVKEAILRLSNELDVKSADGKSEILTLKLLGQSQQRSETILNAIINNFRQDGILDKQLVSKQTLEVIDKRFVYLSGELDSIELGKQSFKQNNRLSYIEADAGSSLQKKSATEDEVFKLENQISLAQILKETVVNEAQYSLLPAEIGLQNTALNSIVFDYNKLALERDKLLPNVGSNHPTLVELSNQLEQAKINILKTVNVYQARLNESLSQLNREKSIAGARYSMIPEKEKMLRSIERQQGIKENLFMLLLQKREEAAINLASAIPSIKVIDYAVTPTIPVSPKKIIIYPLALFLGLFVPYLFLFIRFSLDTKVHDRFSIEKFNPEIPIVGEIPYLKDSKIFGDSNDRSVLSESFRILSTNVNYLLSDNEKNQGKVIFVTSSIKSEGKTLVALNLSLAFASMEKRVLLVGADLRNPQLQSYFGVDKSTLGLSDYLSDSKLTFHNGLHEGFGKNAYHEVYLSGTIPSNAPVLLSSLRFQKFMETAKKEFDYVIVDTAPTLLVTDTLLISRHSDLTIFVVRAGWTDLKLLDFSKGLNRTKKIRNMSYVINGVGRGKSNDMNYGYGYGYETQKLTETGYKGYLNKKLKG